MISWFNAPNEGLSPGGQLTLKTLTATENKTYSEEGTAYTSVTVNVEGGGGGDLTTANVTVNDPNALGMLMNGAFPVEGTSGYNFPFINFRAFSDEFGTGKVALYKGNALIDVEIPDEGTITVSGNAEIIIPGRIKVTGDCTITIS